MIGDWSHARIDALFDEAENLLDLEQWDGLLALTDEAYQRSEELGYRNGIAQALGYRAFAHYIRADLHGAIDESLRSLEFVDTNPRIEGKLRSVLSMIHWSLGNYEDMSRESERASALLQENGSDWDRGLIWTTRGGMLFSLGDYSGAMADHKRAAAVFEGAQYPMGTGRVLCGLGAVYAKQGDAEQARACFERALEIGRELNSRLLLSRALNDMGTFCSARGDFAAARTHLNEALEIREREGYRQAALTSLLDLARIDRAEGNLPSALERCRLVEARATEIGARPKRVEAMLLLSEIQEQQGDWLAALSSYKAYQARKDEITGEQSLMRVRVFRMMAQMEAAKAEQASAINAEKIAAVGSLVAALTHEVNTPLGVIRSSADTTLRAVERLGANGLGDVLKTNARLMDQAAERISSTMLRLKSFAGLDLSESSEVDLREGIEAALAILGPELGSRIRIVKELGPIPPVPCFAAEMNQVFLNLLRNAIEAIPEEGTVTVSSSAASGKVELGFADTGRGIPPERMRNLFEPSFQIAGARVRASLSLFTCLNIVRKHKGDIAVKSQPGLGSRFAVLLPVPA